MKELIEGFSSLFTGFSKAHGKYVLQDTKTAKGKVEGRGITTKTPPTFDDFSNHLQGIGNGIGIIPLMDDDYSVKFAAIDVDVYNLDHKALEQKIQNMPLILCRSKSGGAHLYMFFSEPVEAKIVQEKLSEVASALGHGGCEIFPKQSSRATEEDIGNWINLPYHRANTTTRYALKNGESLTLEQFLEYANQKAIDYEAFKKFEPFFSAQSPLFEEGPPCLNHLGANGGFPDGTRNEGMFNAAIYLRKRFPDDWQDKLQEYNLKLCDPMLTLQEINTIAKSVARKEYTYRCKQPPIQPHCNRRKCLKQAHGIADNNGSKTIDVGTITKYSGTPTIWVLEIDGKRLQCDTDTLYSQTALNKLCMEKINRLPGTMPKNKWEKYLDELISKADIIEVPEDASHEGQFWILVEAFCTGRVQAKHKDELLAKKPWRDGGKIYFQSRALMEYLDRNRLKYKSEHHVWQMLRERGAERTFFQVKGKGLNVWWIPEPASAREEAAPLPQFGTEEF